jgi:hypothetical protein
LSEKRIQKDYLTNRSSQSSAEKKLKIRNGRFVRRPKISTHSSNYSSIQLSSIQQVMSESNLHNVKNADESTGVVRLKKKISMHIRERNLSNPSQMLTPDSNNKSLAGPRIKAASRLMLNRQQNSSRVSLFKLILEFA